MLEAGHCPFHIETNVEMYQCVEFYTNTSPHKHNNAIIDGRQQPCPIVNPKLTKLCCGKSLLHIIGSTG
jgi:hypothetical protein